MAKKLRAAGEATPPAPVARLTAPAPRDDDEGPVIEFTSREFRDPVYVITSAVSNSEPHSRFIEALRAYCAKRNGRLLVVPIWYTAKQARRVTDFATELQSDILYGRASLSTGLTYAGDVPITPTAGRPLSGLQTFGGFGSMDSIIFGHPKVALESIATQPGRFAKLVMTTGAATHARYTPTKVGKKGEFHHVMGAVVVERQGKKFFARQLHANEDGSFYDLNLLWHPDGRTEERAVDVLACGDIHAMRVDKSAFAATFEGPGSMAALLRPRRSIAHDLLDFHSQSHHNNRFTRLRLKSTGASSVRREFVTTAAVGIRMAQATGTPIDVVDSNHNRHFETWLMSEAAARDDENFELYHETMWQYGRAIRLGEPFKPFEFWMARLLASLGGDVSQFNFHDANDAVMINGVEYGAHGDKGPNGSRGSIAAFLKVGARMVIGHGHGPGVMDGIVQVGTMSLLDMEYNKGLSNWMHANCVQYENSKRSLLVSLDGQWRAT